MRIISTSSDQSLGVALNVTQKAKHRIFVGLGWNPNESPALSEKIGALIGTRSAHHDLDLSCFYYDGDKNCLGVVTAQPEHYSDASGSIYHSGDNEEGIGEGDDEQISVALKDLPHNIHHLIFKASIKSGHYFGDIAEPAIRLCDGYTGHCFAEMVLDSDDGAAADVFIFARVYRGDDGWMIHNIGDFKGDTDLDTWRESLAGYIL